MEKECLACRKTPLDKDTIGINKKMLGTRVFNSSKIGKMPAGRIKPVIFCQIFCFIIL